MIRAFAKYLAPVSALQLALLVITLIWCGESDCTGADGSKDWGSLVCIAISKDAPPTHDSSLNASAACSCVCHLKALPEDENVAAFGKVHIPLTAVGLFEVLDVPSEPIIRPPITA